MRIVFKFTSRSRKENFFRGLDSIVNNLADKENYYIQCTFDTSDLSMNNEAVIERLHTYKNLVYYFGESTSKIHAINTNLEKLTDFDVLVNFSDDQVFITQNFDDTIRNDMKEYFPDGDGFLHYTDSNVGAALPTMSVMDKKYFNRTGKIYNSAYFSVYADNHEMDVAIILGRYKYIDKLIFLHLHPCFGKAPTDEQYQRTEDPKVYAADRKTYFDFKRINFGI